MYLHLLQRCSQWHPRLWDFIQLVRLDKPIGIFLLLWPTLTALWIAGQGHPQAANVLIFSLGVVLMRSAGCVINDVADRKFDGHVQRTRQRPLATGRIRTREALILFFILIGFSFLLVLLTNRLTVGLSLGAVLIASLYPFMKRYTHLPQLVLGAAYSWGILMAFSAETQQVPLTAWLLYAANLVWTLAYDTYYAMTDREDDLKIGVKSTAILFGTADRGIILGLQGLFLILLWAAGVLAARGSFFHIGLLGAGLCFCWEFYQTRTRDPQRCFEAFLHNHWAGLIVLMAAVLDYAFTQ